ncbi:nuclear transport factor 2 family protein [Rhodohalobacter sp. 614A]|uniref:nuclear transport factor 2 family protein n=1 Tax=Rhodohalobacter sp. 614A TaxID=2908649 RepID=UPI001F2CC675|nr:DUF4440 domain-containing protein [Rhodohalobacter sp. 614A]
MKPLSIFITLCLFILIPTVLKAQSNSAPVDSQNLKEIILTHDRLFWEAYNSCDIDQLRTFFTDDLEFYHDKNGVSMSLDSFIKSIQDGICSNDEWRLRREAVEESISVFPIDNYGAVISGDHNFFVKESGTNERPEGKGKFFHLWRFHNNTWKMSRVFSYDHGPIPFTQEKTEIPLSEETLSRFTGSYQSSQTGVSTVTQKSGRLFLQSGGFQALLYPESDDTFFIMERNIQFKFTEDRNGTVIKMMIIENGTTVDEAEKIN